MTTSQEIALEAVRQQNEQLCREHPLEQLFWECTLRCNMSCRHCGSDCAKDLKATEMPLGEPLVRHDIVERGREIKRRGFQWGMVTNGHLLDEKMMDDLAEAGIDSMAVDIDGTREQHNWLRNNGQSFDRAMRAIEQMQRIDDLEWDVITCVNSRNINSLDEIKRLLIDAGVSKWRCFTIIPMGRAAGLDELQLTDYQFRDLLNL